MSSSSSRSLFLEALAVAAGALAAKHIYLDPKDPAEGQSASAYCSECFRYGLSGREIEHTSSCVVGHVADLLLALAKTSVPRPLVEGPVRERTIEYFPSEHPRVPSEGDLL